MFIIEVNFMKRISLFICYFILIHAISFAQKFSIAADKENVLYIGVDNPISIAVENVPARLVIAKINNGKITGKMGNYSVYLTKMTPTAIILYRKINGKLKEIGRSTFSVKKNSGPGF